MESLKPTCGMTKGNSSSTHLTMLLGPWASWGCLKLCFGVLWKPLIWIKVKYQSPACKKMFLCLLMKHQGLLPSAGGGELVVASWFPASSDPMLTPEDHPTLSSCWGLISGVPSIPAYRPLPPQANHECKDKETHSDLSCGWHHAKKVYLLLYQASGPWYTLLFPLIDLTRSC